MSIVSNVERVRLWLEKNVCSEIKLKVPDEANDKPNKYQLATPSAFAMFLPTKGMLPPRIPAPIPSVLVRFADGVDDPRAKHTRRIKLQLCFATWNPGLHGGDMFYPSDVGHILGPSQKAGDLLRLCGDGWMDAWNFVDLAIAKLEKAESIDGLRILTSEGISFGQFTEQDSIVEFFPYWYAWVEFFIEEEIARQPESHQQLL